MGEEINAAKIQARRIVEQRRGSPMEPAHYVLVPFHDPGKSGQGSGRKESPGQGVNGGAMGLMVVPMVLSEPFLCAYKK